MRPEYLTLEDLGVAFQALMGNLSEDNLPDNLQMLDAETWEQLAELMVRLLSERSLSSLH
jgi:hypothetical protein